MGDLNPNTPTVRGMETRYAKSREVTLTSPQVAIAMRVKPGAVTINAFHHFLRAVSGTPGLAIELVTDLAPVVSTTLFEPGTDTGATTTGWEDFSNGAVNFGDVDNRFDNATAHARNSTPLSLSGWRPLYFRGDDAGALAGQRILNVGVRATSRLFDRPTTHTTIGVFGTLVIDGTGHVIGVWWYGRTNRFIELPVGSTPFHPTTNIPWTVAQVDDIIDAADADMFGVQIATNGAAEDVNVAWMALEVTHCTENRRAFYYDASRPRVGWTEVAGTGASASPADTWEWLVISCPRASLADSGILALVNAPEVVEATVASGTGEHRECALLKLTHPAGVASSVTELPGEHLAALLQSSAPAIITQSQPYARVEEVSIDADDAGNIGQQITTAAATTYAAVRLPVGWQVKTNRPERPLVVEVNEDINNTGAPNATGTLDPKELADGTVREVQIAFDVPWAASATTQYFVFFSSETPSGKGWAVARADTRSDLIGTGTTVAEIEGASQGGQTDSYVQAGAAFDRYDIPVSFIAPPDPPENFTATPVPAEVDEHGHSRLPPRVVLAWDATSLAANFGGYRLWRRPRRTPAESWVEWCRIDGDEANETEAGLL